MVMTYVAHEFKIFTNINSTIVDPKNFDTRNFVKLKTIIASSRPTHLHWHAQWNTSAFHAMSWTVCLGKSTYARCGIIVNVTPFEPEWEGYVTLEFSNTTPLPAKNIRQTKAWRRFCFLRVMKTVKPLQRQKWQVYGPSWRHPT